MVVGAGPRRYVAHLAAFCGNRGAPEFENWTGYHGQEELAEAVRALDVERAKEGADDNTVFAIDEALRYAEDPEAAARDEQRQRGAPEVD